jgi:hypothetical protein
MRDKAKACARSARWRARHPEQVKAYLVKWRAEHSDEVKAYDIQWRRDHPEHREARKVRDAAYRAAHVEEHKAYASKWNRDHPEMAALAKAKWQRDHPEKCKARNAKWCRANPEKKAAERQRHYALKLNAPVNDLTVSQWADRVTEYNGCCAYCLKPSDNLTQDHMTPLSRGGSHTLSNVIPACLSCNCRKGTKTLLEFVSLVGAWQG